MTHQEEIEGLQASANYWKERFERECKEHEWMPIETAPEFLFVQEKWFRNGPSYLLWTGRSPMIGSYGYTEKGNGRWRAYCGNINPTHWMPLPKPPEPI